MTLLCVNLWPKKTWSVNRLVCKKSRVVWIFSESSGTTQHNKWFTPVCTAVSVLPVTGEKKISALFDVTNKWNYLQLFISVIRQLLLGCWSHVDLMIQNEEKKQNRRHVKTLLHQNDSWFFRSEATRWETCDFSFHQTDTVMHCLSTLKDYCHSLLPHLNTQTYNVRFKQVI